MQEKLTYNDVNIVPKYSDISSRSNVDISTELCNHHLDIPVIASPMESVMGYDMWKTLTNHGAQGIFHRFTKAYSQLPSGEYNVIPSIGVDKEPPRFHEKITTVLIDVAHGHHEKVKMTMKYMDEYYPSINIIAGNIATPKAAIDLIKWGADALRVGIGGGSVCTTRMKTGVGVPMISCIREISQHVAMKNLSGSGYNPDYTPIIADGGIKTPGDIAKALAAGADAVMVGSMFAGTDEAPGEIIEVDGEKYKKYYGSASFEQKGNKDYIEGVSSLVEYKGSVVDILNDIKDGLQSSFSYVGASNLDEFHEKSELIRVSQSGYKEGTPHI